MGKKYRFQSGMEQITEKFGRIIVGKMSMPRLDALLEMPWIGTIEKHLLVMIRFDNQRPAPLKLVFHEACRDAQIGGHTYPSGSSFDEKADRVAGVVGNGKRINEDIPERELITRFELDDFGLP